MATQERKTCSICGGRKALSLFARYRRGGQLRRRGYCLCCHRERGRRYHTEHREEISARRKAGKAHRADPVHQLLAVTRRSSGDLTVDFIRAHLARSCIYCGRSDQPMTLDRIDADRGYLQSNVAPCCQRCCQLRDGMSIAVWLELVEAVRIADRLLGSWECTRQRQR